MEGQEVWRQQKPLLINILSWLLYFLFLAFVLSFLFLPGFIPPIIVTVYVGIGVIAYLIRPTRWVITADGIKLPGRAGPELLGKREFLPWSEVERIGPYYKAGLSRYAHLYGMRLRDFRGKVHKLDFSTDKRIRTVNDAGNLLRKVLDISPEVRAKLMDRPFLTEEEENRLVKIQGQEYEEMIFPPIGRMMFPMMTIYFLGLLIPLYLQDVTRNWSSNSILTTVVVLCLAAAVLMALAANEGRKITRNMISFMNLRGLEVHKQVLPPVRGVFHEVLAPPIEPVESDRIAWAIKRSWYSPDKIGAILSAVLLSMIIITMILVGNGVIPTWSILVIFGILVGLVLLMLLQMPNYGRARALVMRCILLERRNKMRILPDNFKPNPIWHIYRDRPELNDRQWQNLRTLLKYARSSLIDSRQGTFRLQAIQEWEMDTGEKIMPEDFQFSPFLIKT